MPYAPGMVATEPGMPVKMSIFEKVRENLEKSEGECWKSIQVREKSKNTVVGARIDSRRGTSRKMYIKNLCVSRSRNFLALLC